MQTAFEARGCDPGYSTTGHFHLEGVSVLAKVAKHLQY